VSLALIFCSQGQSRIYYHNAKYQPCLLSLAQFTRKTCLILSHQNEGWWVTVLKQTKPPENHPPAACISHCSSAYRVCGGIRAAAAKDFLPNFRIEYWMPRIAGSARELNEACRGKVEKPREVNLTLTVLHRYLSSAKGHD
jgi:hypothetical protein